MNKIEKCECGGIATGWYYYPFKYGFWKYQCAKCSYCFQAYSPLKK